MRQLSFVALFVIFVYGIFFGYVHVKMKEERDVVLFNENRILETSYKAVTQMFSISIENYFHYAIMQPSVLELLHQAYTTDDEKQKAIFRGNLYRLLYPFYTNELKKLGIKQFHFHTPKGESFLRFHSPSENGDPLLEIRPSLRIVNQEKRFVNGFEGGRVCPGFRYVFPIIDNEVYLGSVEVSLSYENIALELSKLLSWSDHVLLLKKSISKDLVFESHKNHFFPSTLSENFVVENEKISAVTDHMPQSELTKIINATIKEHYDVEAKLEEGKNFSVAVIEKEEGYVANFYAIYDLSHQLAAYAVTYSRLDVLVQIQNKYITSLLFGFICTLFVAFILYLLIKQSRKIHKEKIKFQTIVEKTINGVLLLNTKGEITFINAAATRLLGYTLEEVIGENSHDLIHKHTVKTPKESCAILNSMRYQRTYIGEEVFCKKNGEFIVVHLNATPFVQDHHNIGSVVIFRDITQEKEAQNKIEHLAYYDSLTELPNRKLLLDRLTYTVANSKRTKEFCGILFIDLDNFKRLNDTKGHEYGDLLLKEVAQRLTHSLRQGDTVSRFGGDEFVVLAHYLGQDEREAKEKLMHIGYKLLTAIAQPFYLLSTPYHCTASIGGTTFSDHEKSVTEILKEADIAMYEVKKEKKNEIKVL